MKLFKKKHIYLLLGGLILLVSLSSFSKFKTPTSEEVGQELYQLNKVGKYQETINLANIYIKRYPENLDIWVHRGFAYYQLGNCAEAGSDLYHASVNGSDMGNKLLPMSLSKECSERSK